MNSHYFPLLGVILVLKAMAMVLIILYAGIGLGPEEAQYWTWSQHLDWGYYSKPPGIAWTIGLGTKCLGNTELGVRSVPLVIGSLIPMLVYLMAWSCRLVPHACFWAGILMAFSPLGILSSLLAITDVGMVLFWTIACLYIAFNLRKANLSKNMYVWVGVLIAGGALFKWPIYFLWSFILITWIYIPQLRNRHIIVGIVTSLMGLLPSVYWNIAHDWVTFKHVLENIVGGFRGGAKSLWLMTVLDFVGAQAGLVCPILFVLLLFSCGAMYRQRSKIPKGVLFCGSIALISLLFGTGASFFMKMHGNWAVFAYSTAFVVVSWYVFNGGNYRFRWMIGGLSFSVIVIAMLLTIPFIQSHNICKILPIPYHINPFRVNLGWEHLNKILQEAGYDPYKDYLFSDNRCTTSLLNFYGPKQEKAYFLNLHNNIKIDNQFSFWPGIAEEQQGKKGFFVVIQDKHPIRDQSAMIDSLNNALKRHFQVVHFSGTYPLFFSDGVLVKNVLLFECEEYISFSIK